MKKVILLFSFLVFTFQIGISQTFDKEKLNEYFQALEENDKMMGSVAISKDGDIIYQKSIGFSDIESHKKNDVDTRFRIGSISKTFTATLILKAIEEGQLDLSQTIDKYFPSLENSEVISVKNLLNHRSGIHNFTNDPNYLNYNTQEHTEEQMLELINKLGNDFQPDSKAEYSNSNYVLLSYILEKIYHQSFDRILLEKIVKPLHLKNTYYGNTISVKENESNSYRKVGDWKKESETDSSIPLGAGGIVSTSTDLLIFTKALFNNKIISGKSLETMTSINGGYGLGLIQMPYNKKILYGHTGAIDRFSSAFGFFPNENIGFAFTSNALNYQMNDILLAMINSVFDQDFDIPTFKTLELSSEDLDIYLGTYSTEELPIKFIFRKSDNVLFVQPTGQPEISLVATEKDVFNFDPAGVIFQFFPEKNQIEFKQASMKFTLTKE